MTRVLRSVLGGLGAVGLYAACAAGELPDEPPPSTDGGVLATDFGKPCRVPGDCSGGACVDVLVAGGAIEKRCSAPCARDFDCVPGWLCASPGSGQSATCSCGATKEVCDGLDNDCNGVVDDERAADEACSAAGESLCVNGKCGCEHRCGGACVDLKTDALHCGACNAACPPGASCVAGACVCEPPGEAADAGADADASADADADADAAPSPSTSTMMLCDHACVDVASDPSRCGACDNVCGPNQTCIDAKCTCKGKTCGGACVDTASDPGNCGGCGVACAYTCTSGSCGPETIAAQQDSFDAFDIAVQGSKIYWMRNSMLLSCDTHGCASPTLLNRFRTLHELELTPSALYVRLESDPAPDPNADATFSGVAFCPIGGCPASPNDYTLAPRLTSTALDRRVTSMTAATDRLFFTSCDPSQNVCREQRIRVCDLTNGCAGGPATLAEELGPEMRSASMIAASASRVFWAANRATSAGLVYHVRSCALPDCAGGPTTLVTGAGNVGRAVVVADTVFFTLDNPGDASQSGVVRCPTTGCATPTVVAPAAGSGLGGQGPGYQATFVAATSDRVFWGGGSAGLHACTVTPGAGCAGPVTILDAAGGRAGPIAVDATSVYWADGSKTLKRFSHLLQ